MLDETREYTTDELLNYIDEHTDENGELNISDEEAELLHKLFGIAYLVEEYNMSWSDLIDCPIEEIEQIFCDTCEDDALYDEEDEALSFDAVCNNLIAEARKKNNMDYSYDYNSTDEDDDDDEDSEILDMMHPNETHSEFLEHEDF